MRNHVYTFANVTRRQSSGGPIGLDLTGGIAQVFMIWWDREFKKRLTELRIELIMIKRYVDDVNDALIPTELGLRYNGNELYMNEQSVAEDVNVAEDLRTMLLVQSIGNSIHYSIQLEFDCPSLHEDGKMPIFDLKCWTNRAANRILHEFYNKDV